MELNSSSVREDAQAGITLFRTTIVSLNAVLIVSGNVLNLTVLPRLKNINEATKVYLVVLAIVDLTTGLQTLTFGIGAAVTGRWIYGRGLCIFVGIFIVMFSGTSFIVLSLISADRYLAITKPLEYPQLTSQKRAIITIVACLSPFPINVYFLSTVDTLFDNVTFIAGKGQCLVDFGNPQMAALMISELCIFVLGPMVVFALVYLRILLIAWKAAQSIDGQLPSRNQQGNQMLSRSEWKAMRTTLLITGAFCFAWLPFPISSIWEASTGDRLPPTAAFVVTILLAFNAWWNVAIYSVMNREYRRTAKTMFGFGVGRNDFGTSSEVPQRR